MMDSARRTFQAAAHALLALAVIATALALMPGTASAAGPPVFINEIHYDNDGGDVGEGFEIAGPAGTDLSGWTVALYNGSPTQLSVYATIDLSGTIPNQQAGFGTLSFAPSSIQNGGPDGLALVDVGGAVVEFLSYEGTFTAGSGPANGMTSTDIGVSESGSTPVGDSLQLAGNGTGGADFTWVMAQPNTFGSVNTGQTFGAGALVIDCGADLVTDEGIAASTTVAASDADDTVVSMTLANDDVSPTGSLIEGTFTASAGVGDLATLDLNLDASANPGTYTATIQAENSAGETTTCDLEIRVVGLVAIHDVQGSGAISPLDGDTLIIEGIVVGDFQDGAAGVNGDLNGFFVQEEDADADSEPLTSEGIFVFDGSSPAVDVSIGDLVSVRGDVSEFFGQTQITSFTGVSVTSGGNLAPSPATVVLPVSAVDDFETVEGMAVTFGQTLYVSGNFTQARFGEVDLSVGGPLDNPTNVVEPGPDAIALQAVNNLARIQLDDGRTSQNPVPPAYFDAGTLRTGDSVTGLVGVMSFGFGTYEVHPTTAVPFVATNPRPDVPNVGGSIQVAAYNVLNYFTTIDGNGRICGPNGDQGCRGADSVFEFERQRAKIVTAISKLDAEVVGLMEIENDANDAAVADLVAGLNDATAPGTYAYIETGAIGDDAIRVALLYKPAAVSPFGDFAILDSSLNPLFDDSLNRPMLTQSFTENASGAVFTASVNHLKSKGSDCDDEGDPDTGDGQGNCNITRTNAAQAIVDYLATDPTGSGDADFLIMGDLNAYAKEDPIDAIKAGGYTDLVESFIGTGVADGAYSFNFFSQSGYLDHGLATPELADQVSGVEFWHINTDEPSGLDYNSFNQPSLYSPDEFRSSDHDPIVIGLDLDTPMSLKLDTIDELSALLSTGNEKDDKVIEKAIDRVEQSLRAAWWIDSATLDPEDGKHVFDRERQAVKELQKVNTVDVQAAIDQLVEADQILARKQLDTAIAANGDLDDIEESQDNMVDAAAHVADGDYDKAVADYKKAWRNAVKAL